MTPAPVAEEKPSTLLAVFAAIVPFFAFPTGLVLAAVASGGEFAEMVNKAGVAAYGVIGLGMMATMGLAAFAFVCGRVARLPGTIGALAVTLPVLYGAVGVAQGTSGTLAAVAHVNPIDRATITCAGFSESLQSAVLGFDVGAACAGGAAIALLLAGLARRSTADRRYRIGLIASAAVLFGASWLLLFNGSLVGGIAQGYQAAAWVSPADKLTLMAAAAERVARDETLRRGALGLAALLAVVAAALDFLRARSPAALATAVLMLGSAFVAETWVDSLQREVDGFTVDPTPKHAPLIHLEGESGPTLAGLIVTGDQVKFEGSDDRDAMIAALTTRKKQYDELHGVGDGERPAAYPLMVAADATPAGFNRAIGALRAAGYWAFQLIGDAEVDRARFEAMPARMRPMLESMSGGSRWFTVELVQVDALKACERCGVARIEGDELIILATGLPKTPHPLSWFSGADPGAELAVFAPCRADLQKFAMAMSTARGQERTPAILVE